MTDQNEDLEQEALFDIEGPDEDGCVWACSAGGRRDIWCQNLGPAQKVAEKLSEWLASYDDGSGGKIWLAASVRNGGKRRLASTLA